jgi:hypothetical protein
MKSIYQEITDQIASALENGVRPWHQPWSAAHMEGRVALPLRHNGVAYRGVNVLALWMEAMAKGYAAPVWMTFKQAIALGANVARARKASQSAGHAVDELKPAHRCLRCIHRKGIGEQKQHGMVRLDSEIWDYGAYGRTEITAGRVLEV